MKTNNNNKNLEKDYDTVSSFRAIKEKISTDLANMTFEQIKEYLKVNSRKLYAK